MAKGRGWSTLGRWELLGPPAQSDLFCHSCIAEGIRCCGNLGYPSSSELALTWYWRVAGDPAEGLTHATTSPELRSNWAVHSGDSLLR